MPLHRSRPVPQIATTSTAQGFSALADKTGLSSITFTVRNRPWRVTYENSWNSADPATGLGNTLSGGIYDEANVAKTLGISNEGVNNGDLLAFPPVVEFISTPGTYTRKIRHQGNGGTVTSLFDSPAILATLVAEEL